MIENRNAVMLRRRMSANCGAGIEAKMSSGFTLVELLIALVIASIGLASFIASARAGLSNINAAGDYTVGVERAQSHLELVGKLIPLEAGELSGRDDQRFTWHIKITSLATHGKSDTMPALSLYAVEVEESWNTDTRRRSVTLSSYRTASVADSRKAESNRKE